MSILPAFAEKNVPVAFASDNNFAPFLAVTIQSLLEHGSPERGYDVLVLHRSICSEYRRRLAELAETFPNASIRFIDMSGILEKTRFAEFVEPDAMLETYFRLFLPELLPDYDKIVYLDVDMYIRADVAELFDTDVSSSLVAGVRDYLGFPNPFLAENYASVLGDDFRGYFNAGALVMNLELFRRDVPLEKLLEITASRHWNMCDQDILNFAARGRVRYLPLRWNTLVPHCSTDILLPEFETEGRAAQADPAIIHYVGTSKPWRATSYMWRTPFWDTAMASPFLRDIIDAMTPSVPPPAPRDAVAQDFWNGGIGFRYILKYFKGWLRFKLKRDKA